MSENLKVNFKTKILEFKRKHNELVDSSSIKLVLKNKSIENLSDEDLNNLKAGDIVLKETGEQKHTYIVTYKQENHGICLSYFDAGYLETISYDYTNGHWVFNSKDVVEVQEKLVSGTNIKTIGGQSILGSGNLDISGGTKLYKHTLRVSIEVEPDVYDNYDFDIVSIRSIAYSDLSTITNDKNYEVLSYGYIEIEATPRQIISLEDNGMDSFNLYYMESGSIDYIEIHGFVSDTVTPL